jgi:acylphosphatase
MSTAKLKIQGRVQGVFYRESTRRKAQELGISGWVRNAKDGSVEAQLTGTEEAVNKMIDWCRQGPPSARVNNVEVEWSPYDSSDGNFFEIR